MTSPESKGNCCGWLKNCLSWFDARGRSLFIDIGLLAIRLFYGPAMAFGHGLAKLQTFDDEKDGFLALWPFNSATSLALAIFAEFCCSLALLVGFATRISAFFLAFTMGVAAFVFHAEDPFATKEKALLYLTVYIALILMGPGRFSIDGLIHCKIREWWKE
ncbi:MAG: DoxX family protein [Candidatus Sumerlaeota bacterium]